MFGLQKLRGALERKTCITHFFFRNLRTRWEQGYLKDLYHRRVLCGGEPLLHRSAYPNWDYDSEIYAFAHRVGATDTPSISIIRALTDSAFYTRPDIVEGTAGSQPNKECVSEQEGDNSELISKGYSILSYVVLGYLRCSMPSAPEELIQAVLEKMISEEALAQVAKHLGFKYIVRTVEFPPHPTSLSNCFKALLAVMNQNKAETLVINTVIPQILDVDLIEVYPLTDPLAVITSILHASGTKEVKPRLLHSAGEYSAEPIYLVGIFADGVLVGKSPGETVPVAVDMASRNALLTQWKLTDDFVFPLGARAHAIQFADFQSPNYCLKEICHEQVDLTTSPFDGADPLDVVKVWKRYSHEVLPVLGRPLRRRLRHKFSRGSINRRSNKSLSKPRPYTVC